MRLSGLASGMDTDQMIKELMRAERVKVDKLGQQKQIEEWRQNAYNDLNKELANFILKSKEDLGLMSTTSTGVNINSSYKNATWVKNVSSSNDAHISATATSESMNGTHTIEMESLAKGVSGVSTTKLTKTGGNSNSILEQLDGFVKTDIIEFTIGGANGSVTFKIGNDSEGENESNNKELDSDGTNNIIRINKSLDQVSLKEIVSKINNASVNQTSRTGVSESKPLGIQAGYDSGLDKFFIKTKGEGEDAVLSIKGEGTKGDKFISALNLSNLGETKKSLKLEQGVKYESAGAIEVKSTVYGKDKTVADKLGINLEDDERIKSFEIDINGEKITINETDKLEDIVTNINAKVSGLASITANGELLLSPSNEITISTVGEDKEKALSQRFINNLGLNVSVGETDSLKQNGTEVYKGTNAKLKSYKVDGVEMAVAGDKIEYKSNNFTINGVNFTAKSAGIESSVTITNNTDEIFKKIKGFVEEYNKIVDKMNSLVSEKRHRNFKPLTSEEKEAMSDKEVELWEAKAKSGMLKGDEIVSRNIQMVRSGLYDKVEGVTGSYNHITNIGISTEKYVSGSMGGKLIIDELELKKQIENDASGVMDLLFKQPSGNLSNDDSNLSRDQLKDKRAQSGIITRIYDNLAAGMKDIVDKAGLGNESDILRKVRGKITSDFVIGGSKSRIDKQISEFNKRMDNLNQYLINKEESYYRRFTAMEQAMQRANAQGSWLAQQFGGGM